MRPISWILALAFAPLNVLAQTTIQADAPHREWKAAWITHPTAPLREPIVLHFRRGWTCPPSRRLYRSRERRQPLHPVCEWQASGRRSGARRPDPLALRKFNLAPYLHAGHNLITATVWNFGVYAPIAQMSDRTAFLLESEATALRASALPMAGWSKRSRANVRSIAPP